MEILTREEVNKKFQQFVSFGDGEADDLIRDLFHVSLALYDENEKMKAGIEKLREKWNKELRDYPYPDTRELLYVFLNDLSALCGKEENAKN